MSIITWLRKIRWRIQPHEHNWAPCVTGRNYRVIGRTCTMCMRREWIGGVQ